MKKPVHARSVARALSAFALIGLIAGLGYLVFGTRQVHAPRSSVAATTPLTPATTLPPTSAIAVERPEPSAETPAAEALTLTPDGSLAGTDVDGEVKLDGRGNIVLDVDLRRLFDYLLARSGEMSETELRALSGQQLAKLYPEQADALIALFRRYLSLRERMASVPKTDSLALNLDRLSALRTEVLGTEMARAFFADDEALARFALARQQLQASAVVLTPEQRRAHEIALLDSLPEHLRAGWEDLLQQEAISDATERGDLQTQATLLDADARARLQQLDLERAAFEQRVRGYLDARAQITDESAREALRTRWLLPEERARVAALEAIGQEQSLFTPPSSTQ